MFYVIETTFAADGSQTDSDDVAEFATETEANAAVDRLYEPCRTVTDDRGPVVVWDDGSYSKFYVA